MAARPGNRYESKADSENFAAVHTHIMPVTSLASGMAGRVRMPTELINHALQVSMFVSQGKAI